MFSVRSYFFLVLLLCSCFSCKKTTSPVGSAFNVQFPMFNTTGEVIPQDSLLPPRIFHMKDLERVKSGPPNTMIFKKEKSYLSDLAMKPFGQSKIEIPGIDTCKMPISSTYTTQKVKAGSPSKIILKEPLVFNSSDKYITQYGEAQGVTSGYITDMIEDHQGNLWIASAMPGIRKFDGKHLYSYSLQQGLASNTISQIVQDDEDVLWIGTNRGLSSFDGIHFMNYQFETNLKDPRVSGLAKDGSGNLWLAGDEGLRMMDLKTKECIRFDKDSGLLKNQTFTLYSDSRGRIWISYVNGGLSILEINEDQSNPYSFVHIQDENGDLPSFITDLIEDSDGNIWLATTGGILLLNNAMTVKYDEFNITRITANNGLPTNRILSIDQDTVTNEIYISLHKLGIVTLTREQNGYQMKRYPEISAAEVAFLYRDSHNVMWEGTRFGVRKIAHNPFNILNFEEEDYTFSPTRMTKDKWGRMWFGAYGGGVALYEPETKDNPAKLHQFNRLNGMSSSFVDDMVGDEKGNLWIGLRDYGLIKMELEEGSTSGTFINYTEQKNFPAGFVPNMKLDKNDDLWCALYEFGTQPTAGVCRVRDDEILHIGIDQGLISDDTWEFQQNDEGDFWIGSGGNGITRFNYSTDTTVGNATHFDFNHHLLGLKIWSLIVDQNGLIWAGANGGEGLIQIEPNLEDTSYTVRHITTNDGLSHKNILALHEDKSEDIWVGNNLGLSHLKISNDEGPTRIKNYTKLDGFPAGGVFPGGIYNGSDDMIWVRANTTLLNFNKKGLEQQYRVPKIEINDIFLFNEKVKWQKDSPFILKNGIEISDLKYDSIGRWHDVPQNLSLRHDNNYVSFEFSGISINSPHRLRYSYQLEGWSDRWSIESSENVAVFGTLTPGSYTFNVKTRYEQGQWSEPAAYSFTIRPPWWKSWWAYLIYFLAFLTGLGMFLAAQIRKARWKVRLLEEVRTNISVDLHDDVGTIMSGIAMQAEFLAEAKPKDIEADMNQISEMSREAIEKMRDIVWALDPRKDKYENLIDRMHSFAEVMFGSSKFDYDFKVEGISGNKFISPDLRRNVYLIFKEAIQNIHKHSNGNKVNISFDRNDDNFFLSIHDNGQMASRVKTDGLGLSNMELRAKKVGAMLQIFRNDGFRIQLSFHGHKNG